MKRTKIISKVSGLFVSVLFTLSATSLPAYGASIIEFKRDCLLQFSTLIIQLSTSGSF